MERGILTLHWIQRNLEIHSVSSVPGVVDWEGDLQPPDEEDKLEDEEDGDGDEGLVAVLLLGDEGQGEVGVDRK